MKAPLASIPEHLREYITEQNPALYTPMDQAAWRYIMRVSIAFFKKHAHPLYLQGLEITGIPVERIPLVREMDDALQKIGWRAVAVNGFIPTSIFLEFQSLRVLAIACDIRKLENLGYTPSPDIVHEAAGHAPIVADPAYSAYLEAYGQVARNAIISKYDLELYQAIYHLSEMKENPLSTPEQIAEAQKNFEEIAALETRPSEAAVLGRMAWWTTEYGLIGDLENPLIYGAGLLSSIDESYHCLRKEVQKIPFSLKDTIKTAFDITRPQPQLFVAKSFEELTESLNVFADTMAFRRGGAESLEIAHSAQTTVTAVLDTGAQITGIINEFETNSTNAEIFFSLTGAKQVSFQGVVSDELPHYHLGQKLLIPFFEKIVLASSSQDLQRKLHGSGLLAKEGLRVLGHFKKEVSLGSRSRVLLLENVKIYDQNDKVIFEEKLKQYPLFLSTKVVSIFGGAADRKEFALRGGLRTQKVKSHKTNLTPENATLNEFYLSVRKFREDQRQDLTVLGPLIQELNNHYSDDWLLRLELLEIHQKYAPDSVVTAQLRKSLKTLRDLRPELKEMIQRGLEL